MINFVSKTKAKTLNHVTVDEYDQYLGLFTSPRSRWSVATAERWVCDNDAFNNFDEVKFLRALDWYKQWSATCVFVVCPDVVGSAVETTALYKKWFNTITGKCFPIAYVLQDGLNLDMMPLYSCDAIFIGGSNDFKKSPIVASAVALAKKHNKHVHNGRISSKETILHTRKIGCHSFDSTHYIWQPDDIKKHLQYMV